MFVYRHEFSIIACLSNTKTPVHRVGINVVVIDECFYLLFVDSTVLNTKPMLKLSQRYHINNAETAYCLVFP